MVEIFFFFVSLLGICSLNVVEILLKAKATTPMLILNALCKVMEICAVGMNVH